jgi:hypothetical protein
VQIATADGGGGHFDECIVWMLELWVGPLFNRDFEWFWDLVSELILPGIFSKSSIERMGNERQWTNLDTQQPSLFEFEPF